MEGWWMMSDDKNKKPNKLEIYEDAVVDFAASTSWLSPPPKTGYEHLDVFVLAIKCGIYPPVETLYWLKERFGKYFEKEGQRDLRDLLELNKGPGRSTIFVEEKKKDISKKIARDVTVLVRMGLTENKAYKAIQEKCAAGIEYGYDEHNVPSISVLRGYYKRFGSRLVHPSVEKEKPYLFELLMKTEKKAAVVLLCPSADPSGGDLLDRIVSMNEAGREMLGPFRFGHFSLNDLRLPEDTRKWVKRSIKY